MYSLYGLLMPANDYTVEQAHRRLTTAFPQYTVLVGAEEQITIASGDWEFELKVFEGPEVQAQHAAIAEHLGGDDAINLAACARRVEAWSETPDPMMEHFADFQSVVDVLKSFTGVVVIDPKEPAMM